MLATLLVPAPRASAWLYPEHRLIGGASIQGLDDAHAKALREVWTEARRGHEGRLCEEPFSGAQGDKPGCLDLAAFPALAGDHSCSPSDLLKSVLGERWVLDVAAVGSRLEERLGKAKRASQRLNATRRADLDLERVDKQYSSRAGANNAHFLLTRKDTDASRYLRETVHEGAELNGIGIWAFSHAVALQLATHLAKPGLPPEERADLARRALAAEWYGIHFLQDAFAAGHVAGTWGDVPIRKGTHDFYNANGLGTSTWSGKAVVLTGDIYMRPEERELTASVARVSLEQLLDALDPASPLAAAVSRFAIPDAVLAEGIETCKATVLPSFGDVVPPELIPSFVSILKETPIPGLGDGLGALPRFSAEIGPFLGVTGGLQGAWANGGASEDTASHTFGMVNIGARIGLGLEALLTETSDGQIFLEGGITYRSKEDLGCTGAECGQSTFTDYVPRVPARDGLTVRLRLPFWLIPGDLLLATPILAFTSPTLLKKMGIRAANGGALGIEAGIATGIGRFQFVLGREIGATFYGYSGGQDPLLAYDATKGKWVPVTFRSVELDIPFIEYRPFRAFSADQATSLLLQISFGIDIPTRVDVIPPATGPPPELERFYSVRFKFLFDWRRYL